VRELCGVSQSVLPGVCKHQQIHERAPRGDEYRSADLQQLNHGDGRTLCTVEPAQAADPISAPDHVLWCRLPRGEGVRVSRKVGGAPGSGVWILLRTNPV